MTELDGKPVIIASSLTGLLISHSLSRANIPHVLIGGDAPEDQPRLGESINERASLDLWRVLDPEFRQYFHTKSHVSFLNGNIVSMQYIANPNRDLGKVSVGKKTVRPPISFDSLVHIERNKFDQTLYQKVKTSRHCTFIHNVKSKVIHDPASDRVTAVCLEDNQRLENPAYVFDATGPFGLVAKAAGVSKRAISSRERVAWTHHWRDSGQPLPKVWWLYGTNILRLIKDIDSLDGVAWLIPLGNTLSIGISVEAAAYPSDKISKETLIQKLDDAFARRGLAYRQFFPHTKSIFELSHEYFIRDRAYGPNWLLAGNGYIQVWFPTSTGVASSMLAAHLAPKLLHDPVRIGRYYQESEKLLLSPHALMQNMIKGKPFTKTAEAYTFLAKWFPIVLAPFVRHMRVANDELDSIGLNYKAQEKFWSLAETSELFLLSLVGGLISAEESSTLTEQGQAFKHYFDYPLLHIENYFSTFPKFFRSKYFERT